MSTSDLGVSPLASDIVLIGILSGDPVPVSGSFYPYAMPPPHRGTCSSTASFMMHIIFCQKFSKEYIVVVSIFNENFEFGVKDNIYPYFNTRLSQIFSNFFKFLLCTFAYCQKKNLSTYTDLVGETLCYWSCFCSRISHSTLLQTYGDSFYRPTMVYPKVTGLDDWSENCKRYSSLPLRAVLSLFCESVY
jgi:hypothetical protein